MQQQILAYTAYTKQQKRPMMCSEILHFTEMQGTQSPKQFCGPSQSLREVLLQVAHHLRKKENTRHSQALGLSLRRSMREMKKKRFKPISRCCHSHLQTCVVLCTAIYKPVNGMGHKDQGLLVPNIKRLLLAGNKGVMKMQKVIRGCQMQSSWALGISYFIACLLGELLCMIC